ncbi:MAG TPA: hypothetical protein VLW88_12070 [Hyphomicrobium sp.]|jgi:hypothetical protein|nr:hypothetical protein [Hyphomicrobium sp.]
MKRIALSVVGALLLAGVTPAFAKEDCNAGYKDFLSKMSTHISKMSGNELAEYVKKSLGAYDSCMAGDTFSPHGVWDQILADMSK